MKHVLTESYYQRSSTYVSIAWVMLMIFIVSPVVWAHTDGGSAGGFISGISHPIKGWDHIVAMIAVGLWGVFLGAPAIWLLPVVFPVVMALGGVLGILQIPLFAVEVFIAVSAVVLGLCVGFSFKPPLAVAAAIAGIFAIFHGYAHGAELPNAASPLAYSIGFVLATGCIHLLGISLGMLTKFKHGVKVVRSLGFIISVTGLLFLAGIL